MIDRINSRPVFDERFEIVSAHEQTCAEHPWRLLRRMSFPLNSLAHVAP